MNLIRLSAPMSILNKLEDAGLFSRNVPRYTSYPTSPQFSESVGPETFNKWVSDLKPGAKLSIYVHVPFCERLCWFCACRTQGVTQLAPVEAYLDVVKVEIAKLAATLPKDVSIARMHWGGGSPTIMLPEHIESLTAELLKLAPVDPDWEFSVEIDPTAINDAKLDALAKVGMNRASIGVQDFTEKVQAAIGREQSFETTRDIVEGLRKRGINSINMDMVYGLPYQDSKALGQTVSQIIELDPDRVALFGYAHVPWMAKRQKMIPEDSLPGPFERFDLFNQAHEAFKAAGHVPLGIDHFAKPTDSLAIAASEGRLRRNFQGYVDDVCTALIGLGASSISRFPQGYVQNQSSTTAYMKDIKAGGWSASRGIAMSMDDKVRSRAIEMVMCEFEIRLPELIETFGDMAMTIKPDMVRLAAEFPDFVEFDGELLTVNKDGFHLIRIIAAGLDAYLNSAAKHSQAI